MIIRRLERRMLIEVSPTVELNPDLYVGLNSIEYSGGSDEDFLNFLFEARDVCEEIAEELEELGHKDEALMFLDLYNADTEVFYDSSNDGLDEEFQSLD